MTPIQGQLQLVPGKCPVAQNPAERAVHELLITCWQDCSELSTWMHCDAPLPDNVPAKSSQVQQVSHLLHLHTS